MFWLRSPYFNGYLSILHLLNYMLQLTQKQWRLHTTSTTAHTTPSTCTYLACHFLTYPPHISHSRVPSHAPLPVMYPLTTPLQSHIPSHIPHISLTYLPHISPSHVPHISLTCPSHISLTYPSHVPHISLTYLPQIYPHIPLTYLPHISHSLSHIPLHHSPATALGRKEMKEEWRQTHSKMVEDVYEVQESEGKGLEHNTQ